MCEYCGKEIKPIIFTNYELSGARTESPEKAPTFSTVVSIDGDNKNILVDVGVNAVTFVLEKSKIKYCPMCGREL